MSIKIENGNEAYWLNDLPVRVLVMVSLSVFVLFADAVDNALIVLVITTVTFEPRSLSVFEPKTFVSAWTAVKLNISSRQNSTFSRLLYISKLHR